MAHAFKWFSSFQKTKTKIRTDLPYFCFMLRQSNHFFKGLLSHYKNWHRNAFENPKIMYCQTGIVLLPKAFVLLLMLTWGLSRCQNDTVPTKAFRPKLFNISLQDNRHRLILRRRAHWFYWAKIFCVLIFLKLCLFHESMNQY